MIDIYMNGAEVHAETPEEEREASLMGNKSVIHDGVNGYVCNTAEEYGS